MTSRFSKKTSPFLVLLLFLFVWILFPYFRATPLFSFATQLGAKSLFVLEWGGDRLGSGFSGIAQFFKNRKDLLSENERLKEQVGRMESRLSLFDALAEENVRLHQEMGFLAHHPFRWRLLSTRLLSRSPSQWFEMISVDRGRTAGIREGLPVLHPLGVVGRVVHVEKNSSQVMLLSDPRSNVGVMDARTGEMGVIQGKRGAWFKMDYILSDTSVREGDLIVTARSSRYYPQGLPVGTVSEIKRHPGHLFSEVWIHPAVSLSTLDRLFIMVQ